MTKALCKCRTEAAWCPQAIKLRVWTAQTVGGGLGLTAAAPGADLLLKPLLRQPLLAPGMPLPPGLAPPQQEGHTEGQQGSACQHMRHGLLTMDRMRRLICLNSTPARSMVSYTC